MRHGWLQASILAGAALCLSCDEGTGPAPDDERPSAGGKADDTDPNAVDADVGLDARPVNTTCIAVDAPPSGSSVTTTRRFDNLSFDQPVGMHQAPGDSSQWYVVEKPGRIRAFDNVESASSVRTFLDIRSIVDDEPNEAGLLGMAFHPDWPANPRVFLAFTLRQQGQLVSVLTRIRSTDGGDTLDPSTHELLMSTPQPFLNHNGGQIGFGPDGFLYYGLGDGGDAGDPQGNGQNTNTRLGALLRIDVDNPSGGRPYGIPFDNPFAGGFGGQPEIYAWGLRNPWRFNWDRETGDLWLADVGQDAFEEIDIIERGGNYGWDLKEGFSCFDAPFPCDDLEVLEPVHVYDHSQGDRSITGGFVYRGDLVPSLRGAYVYGDIVTGRIWGLFPTASGWDDELLLESGVNMATFAQSHDGEIFIPNFFDGTIHQLVPAGAQPSSDFPQFLSQTGCFNPADPTEPVPGLIPYDVASPLWSDGADKERWMALPPGSTIQVASDGDFLFPVGTVLIKQFELHGQLVETRLLMRHPDGSWGGYTYKWNDDQSDAELLPASETVVVQGQPWRIPSRADCTACHTDAANVALGPEFIQLNRPLVYRSTMRRANQMDTLAHIGMFSNLQPGDFVADDVPRLFALHDEDATLQERARSYLHSNCSNCHRPGGPGRSDADMRFGVPWQSSAMCNAVPETGTFGLNDARLIRPGDPDDSVLVHRMEALDAARMPALGSAIVDEQAVDLMRSWIATMPGCL